MNLDRQPINGKIANTLSTPKSATNEVVSFEECKKYFDKYNLDDQRITEIKNNLVGIVDKIMNSYLDNFR
jgi:hypothetical protein